MKVTDLHVFQRAYVASLELHKDTLLFPSIEQKNIADQLRRSTKSVCSNLAEGFSKQSISINEYRRFLSMAIGSSDETKIWLMYAKDLGYISVEKFEKYQIEYSQISKMLMAIHSKWKNK